MITSIQIHSEALFSWEKFYDYLAVPQMVFDFQSRLSEIVFWYFHRKDQSTTLFSLSYSPSESMYTLSMDHLASYQDYKFLPYLADTLKQYLEGTFLHLEKETIYQEFDEDWIEETIAEEIAQIKGTLSIASRYYISQPIDDLSYITLHALYPYGVNLHSSTPRIYGYLQFMMSHHQLPTEDESEINLSKEEGNNQYAEEESIEVDIPQHQPIGRVKSWQLDGSETYETYSREDIDHLLNLAQSFQEGMPLAGVVLNDIGTIHQEGIGVDIDGEAAEYWFTQAYRAGDTLYAPTNLGDLYRKGCGKITPQLTKAFEAYSLSIDPYAHYRMGQAFEEGWCGKRNDKEAIKWYRLSAQEGHHLALRKMRELENEQQSKS